MITGYGIFNIKAQTFLFTMMCNIDKDGLVDELNSIFHNSTVDTVMIIIYTYYWNLRFLNNVIINKTKDFLPHA